MADRAKTPGSAPDDKGSGLLIGLAGAVSLAAGIGIYMLTQGGAGQAPMAAKTEVTSAQPAASTATAAATATSAASATAAATTAATTTSATTAATTTTATATAAATAPATATASSEPAPDAEFPLSQLLEPNPLPDIALGPASAPVTIVEYASTTCSHCASFHETVLPGLRSRYIDTGKVRLIFREFPRDNLDAAVYMLARCLDSSKYMPFVGVMFENQEKWAFAEGDPVARLLEYAKQAGFTEDSFKKCLSDQKLLDNLLAGRERAVNTFKVNSTPTVFVNGIRFQGGTLAELEALLAKLGVN